MLHLICLLGADRSSLRTGKGVKERKFAISVSAGIIKSMRTSLALSGFLAFAAFFEVAALAQPTAAPLPSAPPAPPAAPPDVLPAPPASPDAQPAPMPAESIPPLPPPPVYAAPLPSGQVPLAAPAPVAPPPSSLSYVVPKALSLTVGWSYTPTNSLPLSATAPALTPQGVNIDAGFLWQVRGFDGIHWPAWVGFMTGFFYYVGGNGISDSLGLDYGIFVKHALFPGRRARLFVGYGLGAAQVWIRDVEGRGIGAYERLSIGADTHIYRFLHATIEFSYRFFDLPTFRQGETDRSGASFQALSLLAGFWFGR